MSYHQFGANQVFMILGRTHLQIGVSRAKFDAESDFEVRLAVARQKLGQNHEKQNFRSENFADFFFSASKNQMSGIVRNAFWQSFVPIEADLVAYRCRRRVPIL